MLSIDGPKVKARKKLKDLLEVQSGTLRGLPVGNHYTRKLYEFLRLCLIGIVKRINREYGKYLPVVIVAGPVASTSSSKRLRLELGYCLYRCSIISYAKRKATILTTKISANIGLRSRWEESYEASGNYKTKLIWADHSVVHAFTTSKLTPDSDNQVTLQ